MSGGDHFLARWSRRKRTVAQAERPPELPPPSGEKPEPGRGEALEENAALAPPQRSAEPLPRIEDLTAESDLSAFLRDGVPEALRQAALRRAWSLDPAIRDFVGPAEYAWDYNAPGAMAGFGAGAAGAIGKIVSLSTASSPGAATPDAEDTVPSETPAAALVATAPGDSDADLTMSPVAQPPQAEDLRSPTPEPATASADTPCPTPQHGPRHGKALPR